MDSFRNSSRNSSMKSSMNSFRNWLQQFLHICLQGKEIFPWFSWDIFLQLRTFSTFRNTFTNFRMDFSRLSSGNSVGIFPTNSSVDFLQRVWHGHFYRFLQDKYTNLSEILPRVSSCIFSSFFPHFSDFFPEDTTKNLSTEYRIQKFIHEYFLVNLHKNFSMNSLENFSIHSSTNSTNDFERISSKTFAWNASGIFWDSLINSSVNSFTNTPRNSVFWRFFSGISVRDFYRNSSMYFSFKVFFF